MKAGTCLLVLIAAACLAACGSDTDSDTPRALEAEWSDGRTRFVLKITGGEDDAPFVAEIAIENLTDEALSFPTPYVMPLCGDTNKNNIRIYDTDGKELGMTGRHADFLARPKTRIAPRSRESWRFELDGSFPRLAEPGTFSVAFWYFADEHDQTTWTGRAEMERLTVVRGPRED